MVKRGLSKQPAGISVLIQQNSIASYRARIFELLSQCDTINFTVAADVESDVPFLETLKDSEHRTIRRIHVVTRLVTLPGLPSFYWQAGTIAAAWKNRPDLVIAMGSPYSLTAWVLAAMGRIRGFPVLFWTHGLLRAESGPKWWVRNALYRLADGLLLYGNHAKSLLIERGYVPERLHVVYNSLDYDLQQQIAANIKEEQLVNWKRSIGIEENDRIIAFTGRLQPVKRLDLLLHAVARLVKNGRDIHIALVGDGEERENLRALAGRLGLAQFVHFLGSTYDEHILGVTLSASDLVVVPSGAGLSVMHAMTFGTPVLIHDRLDQHFPEWEAVEEGVTGFYYKYMDIADLAAKIELALFPKPKKLKMADNCRATIQNRYNPHRQRDIIAKAVMETLGWKASGRNRVV